MGALCKYELVPQSPTHPPAKNQEYSADAAIFLVARTLALRSAGSRPTDHHGFPFSSRRSSRYCARQALPRRPQLDDRAACVLKISVASLHSYLLPCTETIRAHFERFGELTDAVIMRDPISNRSRGFGFVVFKDPQHLETALDNGPHVIDGRDVRLREQPALSLTRFNRLTSSTARPRAPRVAASALPSSTSANCPSM